MRVPAWTFLTPIKMTAASPAAITRPTIKPRPPSWKESRILALRVSLAFPVNRSLFAVLLAERFDDANPAQRLLHDPKGRAFELLLPAPAAAQALAVCPKYQEEQGDDRQRDQRQLEVYEGGNVDHADERDYGGDQWNDAVGRNPLHRQCVVLDTVYRIRGTPPVVVGEREPLGVAEEPGAKIHHQVLARVGVQYQAADLSELGKEGDDHDEGDRQEEYHALGTGNELWYQGLHEAREWFVSEDAIDNDLQRHRRQQRKGRRHQAERQHAEQV